MAESIKMFLIALLLIPIGVISFYQLYYFISTFFVKKKDLLASTDKAGITGKISILIPLYNSESTIGHCLKSIFSNNLAYVTNIVIVLDHCTDNSEEIARSYISKYNSQNIEIEIISLLGSQTGKVAGLLKGGEYIKSNNVLLLDADIVIERHAIEKIVKYHFRNNNLYSSCLIFPYQETEKNYNLSAYIICNNRLYRQQVLQYVKDNHNVSNFPGGLQLVNFQEYKKLLVDGFLEDLVATYHILSTGGKVAVMPEVYAYEIERQTIKGLLLQRIRWTIGAIQNFIPSLKAAKARTGLNEKILISSYHVMWEFQYYVITYGIILSILLNQYFILFITPFVLYIFHIFRSAYLGRNKYKNSVMGIISHILIYPFILSIALVCSVAVLLKEKKFYFETEKLFKRA